MSNNKHTTKYTKSKSKGMTIPELLISVVIGTLLIGIVLSMWYFAYKNWSVERVRTRLRINLEVAMERIKEEVRLSSVTYMSLYKPLGEADYNAISFPMTTPDANGFFTLGSEIQWDKSVIYHLYDNPLTGNTELRRTEFADNNAILTDKTQREAQLANVVANGDGSGGPNAANASTKVIFENYADLVIKPSSAEFDGYSPTVKKSDNIQFGSIKLEPGNHDFKFEVTGKNADSTGYEFGIDAFSITPSGCQREAEFYTPIASSGNGSSNVGPDVQWSGNYHFEYAADAVADYVTFRLYYDVWLESNFNNSIRDNTILTGNDLYVKLPDFSEGNVISWQAEIEAGSDNGDAVKADYNDGVGNPKSLANVTVRNLISSASLDSDGDAVRIKFDSHSLQPLTITSAYIDERQGGQNCVDPPTSATRIKLYFTDGLGNITQGTTIPAGSSAYSNWAIFPIDEAKDYFVTFHIANDINSSFVSYWAGTEASHINSYLMGPRSAGGDYASDASWPAPAGHDTQIPPLDDTCISSASIYALATLEIWRKTGSVESRIYDTKIADPDYNQIGWTAYKPANSDIIVYARSSDDEYMAGAAWDAGSGTNPHSLAIGTGRYAQFKAELSTTPFWTCIDHSAVSVSDTDYKSGIITCPTCGKYLVPAVNCPWIDNVAIDWPGEAKMCDISGYFAQKEDYGIIKLTVDGQELIKGLNFTTTLYEGMQDETYETFLTVEIEPRNTGR